jgi:tetratricopeptide (TPR) repeat protein
LQQPAAESPKTGSDFEQAIALFSAGRYAEAEVLCRQVLVATPADPHVLHMLALIRADAGAPDEALALLQQALATGVQHPAIHLSHARLLLHLGHAREALGALQESLRLDDRQPAVVALMAKALLTLGRLDEARSMMDAALVTTPDHADLRDASGASYMAQGHFPEAARELERALSLDPDLADAHGNLAVIRERLNEPEGARAILDAGLARWPRHATLRFIRARLQRHDNDATGARAALLELRRESGILAELKRDIEFELGWCADALDETDAAMTHFAVAKDRALVIAAPAPGLEQDLPRVLASLNRFYSQPILPPPGTPQKPMPAFLCSFPRSGTTLLDTMLGAHPDLWIMEEQPAVQAMLDVYLAAGLDYAGDLAQLTPELSSGLRAAYQRVCRASGWDGAKGLIDKSPFATAHLGLIEQAFPAAPVIFLARHPCDVVLSCFMNSFEINSGTVHFTALDSAVELYCGVMEIWRLYLKRLALRHVVVKYEDLAAEPERELRRVLDFLGLPWSQSVLEHGRAARQRGLIPTPSYHQVSRPLYQDASDRWRRYAKYLEPHLSRLEPHIRAFGYEA